MSRPVHFEIPVKDEARAMQFFSNVFGWTFNSYGMENYQFAKTGDSGDGIDGALMKREGTVANSIAVDSIDETMAKVTANGGTLVVPRTEVPGMGAYCYFTDTEGNIHGLWENTPKQ
jgi:predicted enzyme related to lactoylglutathione lyase